MTVTVEVLVALKNAGTVEVDMPDGTKVDVGVIEIEAVTQKNRKVTRRFVLPLDSYEVLITKLTTEEQ